jgi:hypothetical protein
MKKKACALVFGDTLELRQPIGRGEKDGKRRTLMTEEENCKRIKQWRFSFVSCKQFVEPVEGGGVP